MAQDRKEEQRLKDQALKEEQRLKDKADREEQRLKDKADREEQRLKEQALREQAFREELIRREQALREEQRLKDKADREELQRKEQALREELQRKEQQRADKEAADREERRLDREAKRALELENLKLEKAAQLLKDEQEKAARDRKELALVESLKSLQQQADIRLQAELDQKQQAETRRDVRLQRASNILRGVLYPMPNEISGILIFFRNVEHVFKLYGIDSDLHVILLSPFVNERSRKLIMTLPQDAPFESFKKAVLAEHNYTPTMYLQIYTQCFRAVSESACQHVARLRVLLTLYLESRHVNESYEDLIELLLADRYKASLTEDVLYHVADKEGEDWFRVDKLAALVDAYEGIRYPTKNHPFQSKPFTFKNKAESAGATGVNRSYNNTTPKTPVPALLLPHS